MLAIISRVFLICVFAASATGSQGSVGRGPHGGYLSASENFHSELVLDAKKGALIYLMNKKDENPRVEQASVYFLLRSGRFEANYYCAPVRHHFECRMPQPLSRKPGDEVTIKAVRKGLTEVFHYKFPLEPVNKVITK